MSRETEGMNTIRILWKSSWLNIDPLLDSEKEKRGRLCQVGKTEQSQEVSSIVLWSFIRSLNNPLYGYTLLCRSLHLFRPDRQSSVTIGLGLTSPLTLFWPTFESYDLTASHLPSRSFRWPLRHTVSVDFFLGSKSLLPQGSVMV